MVNWFKHIGLISAFLSLTMVSCIFSDEKVLPPSSGRPGDLVVVMDSSLWTGYSEEQVYNCFAATQEGLPQREPLFNVIAIESGNFSRIFKTTKNIMIISDQESGKEAQFAMKEDMWAKDQLVLIVFAKSDKKVAQILKKNCGYIRDEFKKKEIKRLQKAFTKLKSAESAALFEEKFGLHPLIPTDYKLAHNQDNMIWMRKDFQHKGHYVNMGLLVYSFPYTSEAELSDSLLMKRRDMMTKKVKGASPGSYMLRYAELPPSTRTLNINERYVKELRGLWHMKVDFMGGPFIHYAFIDKAGKNVISIDGYVFAPKFDKREYLRELEAIALSAIN